MYLSVPGSEIWPNPHSKWIGLASIVASHLCHKIAPCWCSLGPIYLAGTIDLEHSLWIMIETLLFLGLRINMLNTPVWLPVVSGDQYLLWDAWLMLNTSSGTSVWCSIPPLGRLSGVQYIICRSCSVIDWHEPDKQLSDQLFYLCSAGVLHCFHIHSMTLTYWRCGPVYVVTSWGVTAWRAVLWGGWPS